MAGRPAEHIKATEVILERAYGKPTQMLAGNLKAKPVGFKFTVEVVG